MIKYFIHAICCEIKIFLITTTGRYISRKRVQIDRIKLNNLWNSGWNPKELLCQSNLNFGFRMLNKLIKRILTPTTRVTIKNYVFLRLSDYLLRRYYQFKSYTHIIICKMICDYVLFCDIRQQMISTDAYELVGLIKRRRTFILFNSISQKNTESRLAQKLAWKLIGDVNRPNYIFFLRSVRRRVKSYNLIELWYYYSPNITWKFKRNKNIIKYVIIIFSLVFVKKN